MSKEETTPIPAAAPAAAVPVAAPHLKLVSLTCGALQTLSNILASPGWTKISKEKHAAGKMIEQFEEVLATRPDECTTAPKADSFLADRAAAGKVIRAWERSQAPAQELGELKVNTAKACIKHYAAKEDAGTDRFFAELQEKFNQVE